MKWVAVKELNLSCHMREIMSFGIYPKLMVT